jgi:O-antigen/teichoic acid export membrane protein
MNIKRDFITGTFWTVSAQLVSLLIILVSNIILARLLAPEDFGKLGIIMTFILVANIFTNAGLSGALVRKKQSSLKDFSTVFIFNIIISLFFCLIYLFLSGYIADYYGDPQLKLLLIASSSIIIISSFQVVQNAKLVIAMRFKEKSIAMLASSIIGVLVGISFAYFLNAGAWSLILIPISSNIVLTVLYWYYAGFFFNLNFSKTSFKNLLAFGVNTTLASVLNIVFDNIYQLILGRMFSLNIAGFYYQAKKLQDVPISIINNLSQGVIYSGLAKIQDNKVALQNFYKTMIRFFTTFLGLMSLLLIVFPDFILETLFGPKWLESSFYLQMLSIVGFFYSQELINKVIFKVYNRTDILLRLEFVKKIAQSFTIVIGIYFNSIVLLLSGYIFISLFSYLLNYYSTKRVMEMLDNLEQLIVFKIVLIAAICIAFKYGFHFLGIENNLILIPAIIILYLFMASAFKVLQLNNLKQGLKFIKKD